MSPYATSELSSTLGHFASDEALPWLHPVGIAVLERLPDLPLGAAVLDVACGSGEPGLTLARRLPGLGLLGIDSSAPMIEAARRRADRDGLAVARFRVMNADALDIPSDSADALISRFGLLTVGDPGASTWEAARVLKRGGAFSVAVWDSAPFGSLATAVDEALGKRGAAARARPEGQPERLDRDADRLRDAGITVKAERLEWSVDVMSFDAIWDYVTWHEPFASAFSLLPADAGVTIRQRLVNSLRPYHVADGRYRLPMECRLLHGCRR